MSQKAIIIGSHPATNVGGWTRRLLQTTRLGGWDVKAPDIGEFDVRRPGAFGDLNWKADALIYAAGFCEPDWIWEARPRDLRDQIAVNLTGAIEAVHWFVASNYDEEPWPDHLPPMYRRIVLVGSAAAETPHRGQVAYNAAKAGLRAVVSTLAREIHDKGFRIFLVEPGAIDGTAYGKRVAEGAQRMGLDDRAGATRGTFGRNLDPEEVADFIASILLSGAYDRLAGRPIPYSGGPQ